MTHFLQRTALVALASGAVGAYATPGAAQLFKPNFPIEMSPPAAAAPAQPPAVVTAPPPAPAPADGPVKTAASPTAVEARPLAPLAAPSPEPTASGPVVDSRADESLAATRHRRAAPEFRTVTTRTVTGKVVDVEGPPELYTVKKGDTLEKIARKLDTTVDALMDDNDLAHSTVHAGQTLKGPRIGSKAYVAESGDTLYSIARRFGVSPEALRSENHLTSRSALHLGQKIRLPNDYTDHGPLTSTSRVAVRGSSDAALQLASDEPSASEPTRRAGRSEVAQADYRTVTTRSVTGRVVDVEGEPERYTVKKGDTLEKIARKLDTTVDALKEDNHLRHAALKPGQVLKGPILMSKAYVAVSGDTLGAIAKRFGVRPEDLRSENGLSRNGAVRPGEKIRLPDDYTDHGPLTSTTRVEIPPPQPFTPPPPSRFQPAPNAPPLQPETPAQPRTYPSQPTAPGTYTPPPSYTPPPPASRPYTPTPAPYTPPASAPYPPPATRPYTPTPYTPPQTRPYTPTPPAPSSGMAPAAPTVAEGQVSELGRGRFIWPLQGTIVSDFGPKAVGQRNDGINIGAQFGAPVRAAAAGEVVYAGDQVPGFGNLVLIKHPDGWVTAYGHLSRVTVKMQERVTQGQEIGLAGATGGVTQPQLHFEIRFAPNPMERARPVDPKLVLPRE